MHAWYISPQTLHLLHWPGGHRIQEHAFMFPEHHWNPLELRALLFLGFTVTPFRNTHVCLRWLPLLGGVQAWESAATEALAFSCSNVKVWFRWERDWCAPFILELPLGSAKVREIITVLAAFSPVFSSFGSSGQHVSSSGPVFCSISEGRWPQIVEVICSGQELAPAWSGSGSPSLWPLSSASHSRGVRKYTARCFSAWKYPAAKAKAGCSMLASKAWHGLEVGSRKQQ